MHTRTTGEPCESLDPKYTFNPVLQRFYQAVEKRALDPTADISELDPSISKYMMPDSDLMLHATPAFDDFNRHFALTKLEKKTAEKRHWREYAEGKRHSFMHHVCMNASCMYERC